MADVAVEKSITVSAEKGAAEGDNEKKFKAMRQGRFSWFTVVNLRLKFEIQLNSILRIQICRSTSALAEIFILKRC